VAALGLGACEDSAQGDGVLVVASFYPLAEAAERVGGDAVEVVNLTPAGTEPHDLELSPDQADLIEDAELVIYLGRGFQPAVEELVERRDGPSFDALDDIPAVADADGDPHVWLHPAIFGGIVDRMEEALAAVSPDDAEAFAANADAYERALGELDEDFIRGLADCERDDIVTSHAAFHYLADGYGLEQHAISGIEPGSDPDPDRIAELADFVDANDVTTVFFESLVSADLAEALAREAGVETALLNPIEGLTDEQLEAGETYESVMGDNLDALREALGCR
jgi:zinc transport system substrate-binding protein